MEKITLNRKHRASLSARKARSGYFFVAPFIIGFILIYLPILVDSVWLSFSRIANVTVDGVSVQQMQPVGFDNYAQILLGSAGANYVPKLLEGLGDLVFEVPAVIIFSLFIAVVLNQKMLGRAAFRAIFFVPVIISTGLMVDIISGAAGGAAGGMGTLPDDGSGGGMGLIDITMLETMFAGAGIAGDLVGVVVGLVEGIYNIINYSGVQMLIFLAGLQSISESIYEACRIDGATGWETFWKVTFPMISPMILVNAVYSMIDALTRSNNKVMSFVSGQGAIPGEQAAMYWFYFLVVILIIAAVVGIISTFVFYQRKD